MISRFKKIAGFVALFLLLACLISACAFVPEPGQQPRDSYPTDPESVSPRGEDIEGLPTRRNDDCPGLDSTLLRIIRSENPLTSADESGLATRDDKIQVIIVLEQEDAEFLKEFNVEVTGQSRTQVQSFVPIDRLCEIAGLQSVLAVRAPPLATGD